MSSGRTGLYFSMWKSIQKTFKGILPLKILYLRAVQRRFASLRSSANRIDRCTRYARNFWQGNFIPASDEQWRKPRSARLCFQFCSAWAGDLRPCRIGMGLRLRLSFREVSKGGNILWWLLPTFRQRKVGAREAWAREPSYNFLSVR